MSDTDSCFNTQEAYQIACRAKHVAELAQLLQRAYVAGDVREAHDNLCVYIAQCIEEWEG